MLGRIFGSVRSITEPLYVERVSIYRAEGEYFELGMLEGGYQGPRSDNASEMRTRNPLIAGPPLNPVHVSRRQAAGTCLCDPYIYCWESGQS